MGIELDEQVLLPLIVYDIVQRKCVVRIRVRGLVWSMTPLAAKTTTL